MNCTMNNSQGKSRSDLLKTEIFLDTYMVAPFSKFRLVEHAPMCADSHMAALQVTAASLHQWRLYDENLQQSTENPLSVICACRPACPRLRSKVPFSPKLTMLSMLPWVKCNNLLTDTLNLRKF